jgi:hypothetical protein
MILLILLIWLVKKIVDIKRDELFHFIRWMNLIVGVFNLYIWNMGGGYHMLGLAFLNIVVWTLTRKPKKKNV